MYKEFLIFSILITNLFGCAVTDDPRKGGLIGGIQGIYGRKYQHRIEEKQNLLNEEKKENCILHKKINDSERQLQLKNKILVYEQGHLIDLEEKLSILELGIAKIDIKSGNLKKEIINRKDKIERLRKLIETQTNSIRELSLLKKNGLQSESYLMLQKERDRLYEEYKALFEYYEALAEANS